MVGYLVFMACSGLAVVLANVLADWRDRPLWPGPGRAGALGIRARVAGDGESWPARPVKGDLWVPDGDGPLYFVDGVRSPLPVARGGRVLDTVPLRGFPHEGPLVVRQVTMVYQPPDGAAVLRLRVPESAVPLVGALTGPAGPAAGSATRPPHEAFRLSARRALRVPRPAALALMAALLLGLFGLHTFVLGKPVTAEVTAKRDGVCSVRWQDPWSGGTRTAGVDCYGGERAGDPLRISARPRPVRGEAADLEDSPFMLTLGLAVTGTGGVVGAAAASLGDVARLRALRRFLRDGPAGRESSALRRAAAMVPWWSVAAGVLGLVGAGVLLAAYGFGTTVRATVTGTEEYVCRVSWPDPWDGTRESAEVDCDDRAVRTGRSLEVTAPAGPLRGEAFDREITPWVLGGGTAVFTGLAAAGIVFRVRAAGGHSGVPARSEPRTRDADRDAPVSLGKPVPAPAGADARTEDVLDRAHLAAVSRLLASRLAGPVATRPGPREPDIRTTGWWRSPRLRRLALASGVSWGGLLVLAVTAGLSGWWWVTVLRLWGSETATARATVALRYDDIPFSPWLVPGDAEVTFRTADGRKVTTDLAYGDEPAPGEGDRLTVEYAVQSPSAARLPGDPGLDRGLWISGGVAAAALIRVAWCGVSASRVVRHVLAAARGTETRTACYLLLPDPEDPAKAPLQLVFFGEGENRPFALLEAVPGRSRSRLVDWLPLEGTAELRSVPGESETVVPWVDGRPVWPRSPLFDLSDPEEERDFREYVEELTPPWIELPGSQGLRDGEGRV
ncbi:hypothetical protein ACF09G_04045 [Streptomyces albogriseolus]|uniref:Uncharacterized protein n=2 Tax=unclassified Streptomyces TaxID=2593676 RepID=V9Z604_9ACTN|nr:MULTISPECIES: hypothetical protein [unclassified Streptomyces]AHE38945.1 hypothetical protein pFRL3_168 [Streptomyces sp. FR1]AHE39429.1 hypothetical protein pFRL4_196 [Streptomyces sp. F2]